MNWYEITNVHTIDSPALVIYSERMHENIRLLKSMVNGEVSRLRPHVKTNKIAEVCQAMMDAGITKFKCATIAEAEMLATIGAPDVLFAYQPVGPKASRFIQLIIQFPATRFSCLVDNSKTAHELSGMAGDNGILINVFIDVNTGMNRTGITPAKAFHLVEIIETLPGIQLTGLHIYDGHIQAAGIELRTQHCNEGFESVLALCQLIEDFTQRKLIIVAGGSPTFPIHAVRKNMECSPGTFIFWDQGYHQHFPGEPFLYAALVITRIISIVDDHTITTDLGHKSVAAENPLPRVYFLNAPNLVPYAQSEEHLVLKVSDASTYNIGDVLYGVPVHICPTVALYHHARVIRNNTAIDEWKVIAADRKITI